MKKIDNYNKILTPIELLTYMNDNIKNGFMDKNGIIYSEENYNAWPKNWQDEYILSTYEDVKKNKIGTCLDQVEFERQWFLKHNYECDTYFMWFNIKKELPTHAFLIYKSDNKYYWFENNLIFSKGIYESDNLNDLLEYIIKIFIEYAIKEYKLLKKDYKYLEIFKYEKPKKHCSIKEFTINATKNKINL